METNFSPHNVAGYVLKEFPGIGLCVLAVKSQVPGTHKAPGGRNTFHPNEASLLTLKRKFREDAGIELVLVSKAFYADEGAHPHYRHYIVKQAKGLPGYGWEGRGKLRPRWLPVRDFWKNAKTRLLDIQKPAFEKLVLEILAKDDAFRDGYDDLIKEIAGFEEKVVIKGLSREQYFRKLEGFDPPAEEKRQPWFKLRFASLLGMLF